MSDSCGIIDGLEIRDIRTGFSSIGLAVLEIWPSFPIWRAKIPRFYELPTISDDFSSSRIDHFGDLRRAWLIAISEVFLEFIRIIRSIIERSVIFPIFRIDIVVGIGTSSCDDSFDFLGEIAIRYFSESLEVILDRKFVHDEKIALGVSYDDLSAKEIIVILTLRIPARYPWPWEDFHEIWLERKSTSCIGFIIIFYDNFIISYFSYWEDRSFFEWDSLSIERYHSIFYSCWLQIDHIIIRIRESYFYRLSPRAFQYWFRSYRRAGDYRIRSVEHVGDSIFWGHTFYDPTFIIQYRFYISYISYYYISYLWYSIIEVISWATRISEITMSGESIFSYCFPDACTSSTGVCSCDSLRYIDTVFLRDIGHCFDESCFLVSIEIEFIIIPDYRYTDRTIVVPIDVSSLDIVTSGSSLVDFPSLSDNIVISDISPSLRTSMIGVYSTQERLIICSFIERLRSMVDDDTIYFFGFLDRPYEFIPILISLSRYSRRSFWIEREYRIHFSSRLVIFCFFLRSYLDDSWSLSSLFPLGDTTSLLRNTHIAKRLISSPLLSSYYTSRWVSIGSETSRRECEFLTDTVMSGCYELDFTRKMWSRYLETDTVTTLYYQGKCRNIFSFIFQIKFSCIDYTIDFPLNLKICRWRSIFIFRKYECESRTRRTKGKTGFKRWWIFGIFRDIYLDFFSKFTIIIYSSCRKWKYYRWKYSKKKRKDEKRWEKETDFLHFLIRNGTIAT